MQYLLFVIWGMLFENSAPKFDNYCRQRSQWFSILVSDGTP
jgi:hypothetical protein